MDNKTPTTNKRSYEKINVEQSLRFIDAVREKTILWKKSHKNYKNATLKNDAWAEIAEKEGMSLQEAKIAWKKLLSCYRTNKSKARKSQMSGAANDEVFVPRWFGFEAMAFVGEAAEDAGHVDTLGDDEEGFTPRSLVEEYLDAEIASDTSYSEPSTPILHSLSPTAVHEGHGVSEALNNRLPMPCALSASATPGPDDPDEFATYVANVLRTFPERKRRLIMNMQRAILHAAQMEE